MTLPKQNLGYRKIIKPYRTPSRQFMTAIASEASDAIAEAATTSELFSKNVLVGAISQSLERNEVDLSQDLKAEQLAERLGIHRSTVHGVKYIITGTINTPVGRMVSILTVWIINAGEENPRFVTARSFLNE